MWMDPRARALLARQAYERAIAAARVAPTPRRWRKLVAAAANVRSVARDCERERLAALGHAARALAVAERAAPRGRVLVPFPSPRADPRWAELVREWDRARALIEQAHRLVREAGALQGSFDLEQGRRQAPRRGPRSRSARPR